MSAIATTLYIDKMAEVVISAGVVSYRSYIDDIAIVTRDEVSGQALDDHRIRYTHRDRLGSVISLTDHNNLLMEHRSYDPFGKPRHGNMQDPLLTLARLSSIAGGTPFTTRGFTDHEHLDDAELIHMNGRVYDYNLGRFLSVDPFIQAPGNSQSLNPYSYIMNNPLAGTDPSGYLSVCDKLKLCSDMKIEVPFYNNPIYSSGSSISENGKDKSQSQSRKGQNSESNQLESQSHVNVKILDDVVIPKDWKPKHLSPVKGTADDALTEEDRKLMYLIDNAIDAHIVTVEAALRDPGITEEFRDELIEGLKHFKSATLLYSNEDRFPRLAEATIAPDGTGAQITFFRSASEALGKDGKPVKAYGEEIRLGYAGIKDLVNHEAGHLILKNVYVIRKDKSVSSLELSSGEIEENANDYLLSVRPYDL